MLGEPSLKKSVAWISWVYYVSHFCVSLPRRPCVVRCRQWQTAMDEQEGAQVVIPELEDEGDASGMDAVFPAAFHSLNSSAVELPPWPGDDASPGFPTSLPRKAGRLRHIRSGSLNADESASISTKSSLRIGSSFTNAFQSPSRERADAPHNFSFPVKKPSFASLRAAIKGAPMTPTPTHTPKDAGDISSPFGRSITHTGDISAVSSGLAQVTGLQRPAKWHFKSNSQASYSDVSAPGLSSSSPSRSRFRHTRKGSQLSDASTEGTYMSPSSSAIFHPLHDGSASPIGAMANDEDTARLFLSFNDMPSAEPMTFAVRQIIARFQALADDALHAVLTTQQDCDILQIMFPTAAHRAGWDDVLQTLASIARHDRALVTDSLLAWRADALDQPLMLRSSRRRPSDTLSISSVNSVAGDLLRRRRALASTYLTCRALLVSMPHDANDHMGTDLDDIDPAMHEFVTNIFQFLHLCSIDRENERGSQSQLHASLQQHCFDVIARLLGELSRQCLPTLGHQFLSILHQSSTVAASRENELLTEAAVLGMRYLRITIYPMDVFEAGAEFLLAIARFFAHSHGYRIKRAFARVLNTIIEPVARSASAELNHPTWMQAMNTLLPKAQSMAVRSRYCSTAYPLWAISLCASPPDLLVERWFACVEAGWSKLKERPKDGNLRLIVYVCAAQLFWAYLFRCYEGTNPTQRRLDAFFGLCLPPPRSSMLPTDRCTDACVDMLTSALYRQFDYTHAVIFDLLRQSTLEEKGVIFQPDLLHPTRMCIAIRAVALTLHAYVSGEAPALPGIGQYSIDAIASEAPPFSFPNARVETVQGQFDTLITQIALHCDYVLKDLNVLDEQMRLARGTEPPTLSIQNGEHYEIRTHANNAFTLAYSSDHQPYFDLLRTCIDTWPRCMSRSIARPTCYALLFRGLFCVDPSVQSASASALVRIARSQDGAAVVLRAFLQWLFRKDGVVWELQSHADVLVAQFAQVIDVFVCLLDLCSAENDALVKETLEQSEASALLLLCIPSVLVRQRVMQVLLHERHGKPTFSICADLLAQPCMPFLDSERLSASQKARIAKWNEGNVVYPLSRLAMSTDNAGLWVLAWPHVLWHIESLAPHITAQLYAMLLGSVQRLEPSMASIAHLRKSTARVPATLSFLKNTWHLYIITLCTTGSNDTRHISMLMPYVVCEEPDLQDMAAEGLCHVRGQAYPALVAALATRFDDAQWPVRLCIGRILAHTSPMLPHPKVTPLLLTWIHRTLYILQLDLPPDIAVYQLRRYFCTLVAALYTSTPAAFPVELRMRLLAVMYEWHSMQSASRLAALLAAAVERTSSSSKDKVIVSHRHELHVLAQQAESAIAALCAGTMDNVMPGATVLSWLCGMLASASPTSRETAQRGMSLLLSHNTSDTALFDACITQCYCDLAQSSGTRTTFLVLADVYTKTDIRVHEMQILCVALCLLAHPDVRVRVAALSVLEIQSQRQQVPVSLVPLIPSVRSFQPAAYLDAQRAISHHLYLGIATTQASAAVLAEFAWHIEHIPPAFHEHVVALLPAWLRGVSLDSGGPELTHLLTLTHMLGATYPLAIRDLWQALSISTRGAHNLLEMLTTRSLYYRSVEFLHLARSVIASVSQPAMQTMQYVLYESLTPDAMMASVPETLPPLPMDSFFPPPGTELGPLAPSLVTLFFLSECVDTSVLHRDHLPVVLHVLCMYIDSVPPALHMGLVCAAEQILSVLQTKVHVAPHVDALHAAYNMSRADFITFGEMHVPKKLEDMVAALCRLAEAHVSNIRDAWCDVALMWATHEPVRRMACRSLQVMRTLRPTYPVTAIPSLLARLADTLSLSEALSYTLEVLSTLEAMLPTAVLEVLPPIFWALAACSQTPYEPVFAALVAVLQKWMDHVDMSTEMCETLWASRPEGWDTNTSGLQCALVRGLRLSQCDAPVLRLLERMAHIPKTELLEATAQDRVLTLLAATLPWCMLTCESESHPHSQVVSSLGDVLTHLANDAQRTDIARITASIARRRFRRGDDLARQAATVIAAGCTRTRALHLVTLLVLTLYHDSEIICRQALLALPPCLAAMQSQGITSLVPGVPLDPVVRLLRTPLASLALDVLHSPMFGDQCSGPALQPCGWTGPSAQTDAKQADTNIKAVSRAWEPPERGMMPFVTDDVDDIDELDSLANQLDDLASFFVQDSVETPSPQPTDVAKVLARSTRDSYFMPGDATASSSISDVSCIDDVLHPGPRMPRSMSTYPDDVSPKASLRSTSSPGAS